jgi:hypothetical protein
MALSKLSSHRSVMSYEPDFSQSRTEITLFLQGSKTPLMLRLTKQTTLGRSHKASPKKPDVDLTPYNAYEKGVSRIHLAIQWHDGQLTIMDLGSANGTWLNRRRLTPNKVEPVSDGDEIRLGKLVFYICLKKTTNIADCRPSAVLSSDRLRNSHEQNSGNQDTKRLSTEVLRRYWVPESSGTMSLNFPDEDEAENQSSDEDEVF